MEPQRGRQMSHWGIGPVLAICTLVWTAGVVYVQHRWFRDLKMVWPPPTVGWAVAVLLIGGGIIVYIAGARRLLKAIREDRLETHGVYAWMRHPIYSAFIVFLVPGVVLILRSVLGVTIPLFMYGLFRLLIRKEERYLAGRFGNDYWRWRRRTGAIFPTPPTESA